MKRKYSSGGGIPTTGGTYESIPPQYPFPPNNGGSGLNSNTTVNVNGQELNATNKEQNFDSLKSSQPMRRGGKVKVKKYARGGGIEVRGKTRGRFV
jgi:hypothetical protein